MTTARTFVQMAMAEPVDLTWARMETNPDGADHEIAFFRLWMPLAPDVEPSGGRGTHLPAPRQRLGLAA